MPSRDVRPRSPIRQIIFRTIAGILAVLGVWAIVRNPSHFLWSIGPSWVNRIGTPFLLAAFVAYAAGGERLAYQILKSLTVIMALPDKATEKVLGRIIEPPPELSESSDRSPTPMPNAEPAAMPPEIGVRPADPVDAAPRKESNLGVE